MQKKTRPVIRAVAAVAAGLLALSACGGGSDDKGAEDKATSGAKELRLWHYEPAESAMGKAWTAAIAKFEASHPGVKVKFEEKSFEQINQSGAMALNSAEAPDILEFNKGNATAGLIAKQGLLTDISDEVTKRGWDKMLSSSLQTTAKYDDRGIMGSGKWYGIPNYGEFVTVYYNQDLFKKYDLKVPTTMDEFTKVMDAFVAKKVTPLANAGAEYAAQQYLYELALSKADRSWVDKFQLYKGKNDFKDPAWTYAAQTFSDWVKKGYIAKTSVGTKAEDMGVSFMKGDYPILVSGSWWWGRFQTEVKDFKWGSFLFPGNTLNAGSSGNLWVVPKNSKAKDLAYDFIDITMSKEIQNLLGNSGGVPVAADPAAITDPKSKELIELFSKVNSSDGLAFYPDWPAPGYYDVLVQNTQKLINGSATPDKFLDSIAKPYDENVEDQGLGS
jgi:raffinose/stachyose/melibiose transport system substrate-binding protein